METLQSFSLPFIVEKNVPNMGYTRTEKVTHDYKRLVVSLLQRPPQNTWVSHVPDGYGPTATIKHMGTTRTQLNLHGLKLECKH